MGKMQGILSSSIVRLTSNDQVPVPKCYILVSCGPVHLIAAPGKDSL